MEVSDQFHALAALPPGEIAPGTHWIGGWVGPNTYIYTYIEYLSALTVTSISVHLSTRTEEA